MSITGTSPRDQAFSHSTGWEGSLVTSLWLHKAQAGTEVKGMDPAVGLMSVKVGTGLPSHQVMSATLLSSSKLPCVTCTTGCRAVPIPAKGTRDDMQHEGRPRGGGSAGLSPPPGASDFIQYLPVFWSVGWRDHTCFMEPFF